MFRIQELSSKKLLCPLGMIVWVHEIGSVDVVVVVKVLLPRVRAVE